MAVLAAACGSSDSGSSVTPQPGGGPTAVAPAPVAEDFEIVLVDGTDIATLDGAFIRDVPSQTLMRLIYDTLVEEAQDGTFVPSLAKSWAVANDGLTWTFKLRDDVVFSNGVPFTAQAVVANFERIQSADTASPNASFLAAIVSTRAVSDFELELVTGAPFPDLLLNLTSRGAIIAEPGAVEALGADFGVNPVGTGPYSVTEWVPGERIVMDRNEAFWGESSNISRITYRPIPESAVRSTVIRTGEADIAVNVEPQEVSSLESDSNIDVDRVAVATAVNFELLTNGRVPLDDVRVRQAINHAVDKNAIVDNILLGLGTVNCSPTGPAVGAQYYFTFGCYDYDPELARRLLAEAGYPNGFTLDMWAPSGRYVRDRQVAEAVQAYLQAVGITANLETFAWTEYLNSWAKEDRAMWMLGRGVVGTDFVFTREFSRAQWDAGSANTTRFADDRVEEILVAARSEFDVARRAALYQELQSIVWNYAHALYLHTEQRAVARNAALLGVEYTVSGEVLLRTATMTSR